MLSNLRVNHFNRILNGKIWGWFVVQELKWPTILRILQSRNLSSEIWVFHIPHGLIRTHKWLAPNTSGFIAQLVRVSHRFHEVTGSNPVEVLTFSSFCTHNCNDHSLLESRNLLHCVMCSSIGVRPWAPVKNFIPSVHQSTGSLLGMML